MQAAVWGPVGWKFLHTLAHGYPEVPLDFDRENGLPAGTTAASYERFFVSLGSVLPCKYCRDSYLAYISASPPRTECRSSLTKWLWEIHNRVNCKLDATYSGADFKTVSATYESFRAKCGGPALGCTMPEANNTKKRARVTIEEVRTTERCKCIISIFLALIVAYAVLRIVL